MRWAVILARDATETASVTVEADNEDQARDAAIESSETLEWTLDDNAPDDPYVILCEPRRV